jgi:acyl-coenzyme A thioesterase PaaI-like protein
MEGRADPPPAAELLGWKLIEVDPDEGTIEVAFKFVKPAAPGELRGTGRIVRRGRDVAFLAGELRDSGGDLVATATATAAIRRPSS